MERKDKEVDFKKYCATCVYKDIEETEDPCNECLAQGANEWSRKPIKYKEEAQKRAV